MIIHVVKEGETINSIADSYDVSVDRLILENELEQPVRLALGQTLVVQFPKISYTIQTGDTLGSIASKYGVSVLQLLRNNPYLSDREYIYPGETIVISYEGEKIRLLSIDGYAYPFIDMAVLKKTLPYLTYLTIFSYQVSSDGNINNIEDENLIQTAKAYGVAPIMMIIAEAKTQAEEIEVIHSLLTNQENQDRFIQNLISILKMKEYYGVTINTPFILPNDRSLYNDFVTQLASHVSGAGFKIFDTFSIRVFQLLTGTLFIGLDYSILSRILDGITLISFEFGYSVGIPPGTVSIEILKRFINEIGELIPSEKTKLGIPVTGYVWKLPYDPAISRGMAISYDAAIDLAINTNSEIQFDETTYSAYFEYLDSDEFVVRFWDARSIDGLVKLVPEYKLDGVSIWNIMVFFPEMWLVINSQYDIEKVLLES